MIEHVIAERDGMWDVIAKGRGVAADAIVETHMHEITARERMQRLNRDQMGRPPVPSIGAEAHKSGCTCARGVMLPGDKPCPIEGH